MSQPEPPPRSHEAEEDPTPTTVVTGADRAAGAIVVALLTQRGHHVIGVDTPRSRPLGPVRDGHHDATGHHSMGNVPALARLVAESHADLVIPTLPAEVAELSAARTLLEGLGASVMIAGAGPVALASDRLFALSYLHSRDVRVPRFALPGDVADVREALELFGGPFVASPRSKRNTRSALLIADTDSENWEAIDDDWILRETLPGDHYRVMAHRPVQGRSGRLAAVVRDPSGQDRPWGPPAPTGIPESASRLEAPEIERRALAAIRAVGLTGPSTVEIMLASDGSPVVTDIDATFGQHLRLAPELLDVALAGIDPSGGEERPPATPPTVSP